jgi:hypothetical protein
MAVGQGKTSPRSGGQLDRLFAEHPRALGMTWASHAGGAVRIAARMIAAGAACLIHAIVPGWFQQTAGRTVEELHSLMVSRRTANPNDWPDYEI